MIVVKDDQDNNFDFSHSQDLEVIHSINRNDYENKIEVKQNISTKNSDLVCKLGVGIFCKKLLPSKQKIINEIPEISLDDL